MVSHLELGSLLFRDILRMSQYPGSPFTGEILSDLVMFFFIPTVFIILLIYVILGMLFLPEHRMMRLLFGIALYLFIIFGGYFSTFALIAGPLFLWLIFGLGLIAILSRFAPPILRGRGLSALPQKVKSREEKEIKTLKREIQDLRVLRDTASEQGNMDKVKDLNALIATKEDHLDDLLESMGKEPVHRE